MSPELGQRLSEARAAAGLSLSELARRSGVTRQAISNIEMGLADPTTETVQRLAYALSVSPAWLAFGTKNSAPDAEPRPSGR